MKLCFFSVSALLLSTLSALAEPPELPVFSSRPLHVLISKQVHGLTGRDYIGDYVQYSAIGQDLLSANFKIPFTDERLKTYFLHVKEAVIKGFANPYASILTIEAVKKFGSYSDYDALFIPQNLDPDFAKLKLESFHSESSEMQHATDIQPMLALEVDGITFLFYYLNIPGKTSVIEAVALVKKGETYFPIFHPHTYSLFNDIISAFAFQTENHYLPIYIEEAQ